MPNADNKTLRVHQEYYFLGGLIVFFRFTVCLAIFMLAASGAASAYRPFGTEDAGVAGKGVFQTELSWDYLKWRDGRRENVLMFIPIWGITGQAEVSAEIPHITHLLSDGTSCGGVGDINLAAKYLLAQEGEHNPAFTLKGVCKINSGDFSKGLGSGDWDWTLVAAASRNYGRLDLHAQFGYSWIGRAKNSLLRDITLYGLAADFALTDPLHLLCEINGNRHSDSAASDDPRNFLAGLLYKMSDKVVLDAAAKFGLSSASPTWNAAAGASITF